MQLETGHPICSLCKRELTSFSLEDAPGARLCDECRGLIETALHGVEPRAVAASAGVQQNGSVTYVQRDASTVGRVETTSPGFFEDLSTFADTYKENQESAFSGPNDGSFEMHFEDEPSAFVDSEAESLDAAVVESTEHHDETLVATAPSNESLRAELSELHLSLSDDLSPNEPSSASSTAELAESGKHTQSIDTAAAADPWEDPLPAWDYSRSEWPVLMGPPTGRSLARFKVPFAVLMILAFGAGFYYLIYPQISRDQPLPTDSVIAGRAPEPRASAQKPADSTAQSQAPSTPTDAAGSVETQPAQKAARDAGVAGETRNAQGRFALQAAAFPTQAEADEFAEKLKAAGVPSYVVSADLARRGRWFRVRVGRFNTAEDAQRFAAEALLRAKAAGISLQLIVSQYEQP